MFSHSRLAILRTLLSRSPSLRIWNQLLRLISNASEQEQGLLVEYALEHLKVWPDELRVLDYVDDSQRIWPLLRKLSFVRRAPTLFKRPYSVHTAFQGGSGASLWDARLWPLSPHITQFRGAVTHLSGDHEIFRKVILLLPEKLPSLSLLSLHLSGDLQYHTGGFLLDFPRLRSLTLQSHEWFSNSFLFGIHHLKGLRELCIEGKRSHKYVNYPPDHWVPLPPRLRCLRMANIFGFSDLTLLKGQIELERLSLGEISWEGWIRYGEEASFPTDWEFLQSLPALRTLELLSCRHVESIGVFGGLTELTNLRLTGLNRCREVAGLGRLQKLESLELMGFSQLSLEELEPLPSLRRLRLQASCRPAGEHWKERLCERFPRLESLELCLPGQWQKVEFSS